MKKFVSLALLCISSITLTFILGWPNPSKIYKVKVVSTIYPNLANEVIHCILEAMDRAYLEEEKNRKSLYEKEYDKQDVHIMAYRLKKV